MSPGSLVLAFDVGTSGVKAVLCDQQGAVRSSTYRAYPLVTLPEGGVEQDCRLIFDAVATSAAELMSRAGEVSVAAVAVTAQMFNLVAMDEGGTPTGMMLSWLDQRAGCCGHAPVHPPAQRAAIRPPTPLTPASPPSPASRRIRCDSFASTTGNR